MECWIYGMLDRVGSADSVGSTCTTPHIPLLFEAGCDKWMVVHVPLLVDLKIKILNLGSTCTPLNKILASSKLVRFNLI